jgi:hypothetical protein
MKPNEEKFRFNRFRLFSFQRESGPWSVGQSADRFERERRFRLRRSVGLEPERERGFFSVQ